MIAWLLNALYAGVGILVLVEILRGNY